MPIVQSIDGCMDAAIGDYGLQSPDLDARLQLLDKGIAGLKVRYRDGSLALLHVHEQTQSLKAVEAALERLSEGARTLVFFGTGGSSLGGQAIAQLGGWFIPGDQKKDQIKRPRTRFYDNLDSRTLDSVLGGLDLEKSRFVIISKSGNTPETLVQCMAAMKAASDAGLAARLPEMFLGVTEPQSDKPNGLRKLFSEYGIEMLDHDPGIGGRFAALTNVGLLPALSRGLDAQALLKGAGEVIEGLLSAPGATDFAPAIGAAASIALLRERAARVQVMMPYGDRLGRFADWYVQLAAESLGKSGKGFSPVAALGPVDQHSQLQLYLDGPRDHYLTILRTSCDATGPRIDKTFAEKAGAAFLGGRAAGDLVAAQQRAIPEALKAAGRPVRTVDVDQLDEHALGALMMHFMLEVILSAHLLDVDPFDQPAIEAGKALTRERLGGGDG